MASNKTFLGIIIVIVLAVAIYIVLSVFLGIISIFFSKTFWIIVFVLLVVYLLFKSGLFGRK
jgi:hypothetical protein